MKNSRSPRQMSKYEVLAEKTEQKPLENDGVSPRIRTLYTRSVSIMAREIGHLRKLAIAEKLPPPFAEDLRLYVKLFGDIVKQQKEMKRLQQEAEAEKLASLTDEQFEAKLKEFLKKEKK